MKKRCVGVVYVGPRDNPTPVWPYEGGCKNPRPLNGSYCAKCNEPRLVDLNRLPRREDPGSAAQSRGK